MTALVAILAVGCTHSANEATTQRKPAASNTSLPIAPASVARASGDLVERSTDDLLTVYAALGLIPQSLMPKANAALSNEQEVRECMEASGFDYVEESYATSDLHQGLPEAEFAAQYGFGFAAESLGLLNYSHPGSDLAGGPENAEYFSHLGAAEQDSFENALRQCRGDRASAADSIGAAVERFVVLVRADDRAVNAAQEFSNCMKAGGFDYTDPYSMVDDLSQNALHAGTDEDLRAALRLEIAVATQDLTCRPAFDDTLRLVAAERIGEYEALLG